MHDRPTEIRTLAQVRQDFPRAAAQFEGATFRQGPASLELEQPPAPGPIWTNGVALEAMTACPECGQAHPVHPDTPPACPPWCTVVHGPTPQRAHVARILTIDAHDIDDIPVPVALELHRTDHRTATGWEAGPVTVAMSYGTAWHAPLAAHLTRAEVTQLAMAAIGAAAVM